MQGAWAAMGVVSREFLNILHVHEGNAPPGAIEKVHTVKHRSLEH